MSNENLVGREEENEQGEGRWWWIRQKEKRDVERQRGGKE